MNDRKVGVALSGGGYRAAAFHIGTLKKLNELGILKNIHVMSTISGGSITGAALCLHKGDFNDFECQMIDKLTTKNVIKYVMTSWVFIRAALPGLLLLLLSFILPFTEYASYSILPLLIFIFLVVNYQFQLLPISSVIEKAYDEFFFGRATLDDFCDTPEIAIGSTNLQTQRHFTFSKRKMEDSTYAHYQPPIYFNGKDFPVSRAVMASSCVPFAFTPVNIAKEFFRDQAMAQKVNPKLVDGGVYDNQGIHKLTYDGSSYSCDTVIVSDAGNLLPFDKLYNNTFTILLRTVETFMARIKNFQMMQNIYQKPNKREIAYLSLGWDLENCLQGFIINLEAGNISRQVLSSHQFPLDWLNSPQSYRQEILQHLTRNCKIDEILNRKLPEERIAKIRKIGTNLVCIKRPLVEDIIKYAADLTELQVRLYCPSLF
jgi:NTE family protein